MDKAVRAASAVMKDDSWKKLSASDRGLKMSRLADLIEQKRELFATIDAWDNGMPHSLSIRRVYKSCADRKVVQGGDRG